MELLPKEAFVILGSWAFWFAAFAGVGALFWKRPGFDGWMLRFWAGWSSVLFFLQLWHFVLPVDGRAVVAVAALGVAGLLRSAREAGDLARLLARHGIVALAVLAAALWLSQLALGGVRNGDSGLYHLPVMHWMAEYPVVPGLGNLHVRFASNQSALLYAALCNAGPVAGTGSHTMNGLLVLVLMAQGFAGLARVLAGHSRQPRTDAFSALFLAPAASLAFSLNLTSPSPDVAVFVCGAALMAMLLRFHERGTSADTPGDLLALAVFAVAGVTVKLSLAFLSGFALAVAGVTWLLRDRPAPAQAARMVAAVAAVVCVGFGGWIARNVMLSGTLVYPVPGTWLPLEWSVPREIIAAERAFINSWQGTLSLNSLQNWGWLQTSLRSFGWNRGQMLLPLGLVAGSLALLLLLLPLRGRTRFPWARLLLPVVVALGSWFVVAPMPRFAGATVWSFAFLLLLWSIDGLVPRVLPRLMVAAAASVLPLLPWLEGAPALSRLRGFEPETVARVTPMLLPGGLEVQVPKNDVCLRGPLLCTPTPTPGLRLRDPADLGAGFVIDPALAAPADAAAAGAAASKR